MVPLQAGGLGFAVRVASWRYVQLRATCALYALLSATWAHYDPQPSCPTCSWRRAVPAAREQDSCGAISTGCFQGSTVPPHIATPLDPCHRNLPYYLAITLSLCSPVRWC